MTKLELKMDRLGTEVTSELMLPGEVTPGRELYEFLHSLQKARIKFEVIVGWRLPDTMEEFVPVKVRLVPPSQDTYNKTTLIQFPHWTKEFVYDPENKKESTFALLIE